MIMTEQGSSRQWPLLAGRLGRFVLGAGVCALALGLAQSGPNLEVRRPADAASQTEKDKAEVYQLLDQIRTAVRSEDWAEAWRITNRLNTSLFYKRQRTSQATPGLELTHVETMAGRDATTRTPLLPRLAKAAYDAGQQQKAEAYAKEALEAARTGAFWWTGDAIHQGNIVLGRLALQRSDVAAAESYLIAAGKAPHSSQLATFGPNMALARDLLTRGSRDAVITYLEECQKLWTADRGKLPEWLALVRAGLRPDFGQNVDY